ncbi:MAG TPA: ATP-binding protein, partial [Methylomirabilota bacterium]
VWHVSCYYGRPVDDRAPRILLLDEDTDDRALIKYILKCELGYVEVEEIPDALSFAQACAKGQFDLVVLEQELRWTDGLAVLGMVKEEWPDLPVIMFTRHGSEEISFTAAKLGVDHYLPKQTGNFLRLPLAVRAALDKHRSRRVPPPLETQPPPLEAQPPRTDGPAADLTPRERHEEDLERRVARLQRANEDLRRFASMASHELQEPARTMERYARVLHEGFAGKLDADGEKVLERLVGGARRLQDLIGDLLSLSRLESREGPFQTVDAEELLATALANLGAAIEESGAAVTHSPLPSIRADPGQIVRLLQNLIGNAVKFRGKEKPCVFISAARADDQWVFSVHDNGVGIEPAEAESIFTPFRRLRPDVPGTGLGLATCRRIVERHGGRLWVKSEPGQGATFYFTIPAAGAI